MTEAANQSNKKLVWNFWQALQAADVNSVPVAAENFMTENHVWHGFDPIGDLTGPGEFVASFWAPLNHAFSDIDRKIWIFFGGKSNGRIDGGNDDQMWVTGTGVLEGTFANDYLSIPASGKRVAIRWGEFCRIEDNLIAETFFLIDVVDLLQQAGIAVLPQSRGIDGVYPPPAAGDGMLFESSSRADSDYSLDHIRRFIFDGLNAYDEANLESMGMADFFAPDVKWYGPGGIGACLSFADFESRHQAPWLHAFPDRSVQDLDALIAEDNYSGAPGWNGVLATHTGDYLGHPATHAKIGFNGLDWWKRDGEKFVENWVFVDMLHLFRQLGVDLLAKVRQ